MRSIWNGSISFGLVTIPVRLFSATESRGVSFHQVHRTDAGRIRYRRVCEIDGEEVSYGDIAKGYQLPDGEVVVLTDDDFADLPLPSNRVIDVLQFVPLEQVDPILFSASYYLEPQAAGTKPYVLLREALEQSGRIAIVKVALRQRESLAALRVREGVFVLEVMLWPDEIRDPKFGFLDEDIAVRPQELSMANSLIETLSADFDPSIYSDDYREALEQLIAAKVEGHEVVAPEQPEDTGGKVVDLMAALRASVDAAKGNRGGSAATAARRTSSSGSAKSAAKPAAKPAAKAATKPAAKKAGAAKSKTTAKATASKKTAKSTPAKRVAARKSA